MMAIDPPDTPQGPSSPAPQAGKTLRGKKYITPQIFCLRIYLTFGYRPSKSTFHRWLQSGKIAAIRIGKLWFIPESAWEEFLKNAQQGVQF
jgi:excisionase family DNA binding protein